MDLKLKNKRVLVLASSSGLGLACAKAFIEEGAHVGICSRKVGHCEGAVSFVVDLNRAGEGTRLVNEFIEKFGSIDILVTNNGGPPKGLFSDLAPSDWQKGFDSLWQSVVECVLAALPHMKEQKWGRILLITSTAAKEPIAGLTVSNALRAGLLGMTKSLSQEVASYGITVNALLPGYTKTERLKELKIPEEEMIRHIPAKRLGKPEELGALAAFLASEQASYIRGQAIACDGGLIRGL